MTSRGILITAVLIGLAGGALASEPAGDVAVHRGGAPSPIDASYLNTMPMSAIVDNLSLDKLANVVVTDSKIAQPQERVTQKIEVIRAAEFDHVSRPRRNLAELLALTSGQFVNVLSRNDANWGSYAGLGPKYNTWLLDGLPIDSFIDGMGLPLWAMERVELHKGPASVMYSSYLTMDFAGNETPLAGTTNFILKDRIDAAETRLQLGAGSWNTWRGQVYHQDRLGNLSGFVGATLERSDYTDYGTPDSWLNIRQAPDYRKAQVYGRASWRFGDDHTLSIFANRADHAGEIGRPNRDYTYRYDTLNLAYSNRLSDTLHVQAKYGYRDYDRRWGEDNFPQNFGLREHDGVRQRIQLGDATLSWQHAPNALLTVGVDAQQALFRTYAEAASLAISNDVTARSQGVFIQEKLSLDRWTLRAGARYNAIHHDYRTLSAMTPPRPSNSWSKSLWSLGFRYAAAEGVGVFGNAGNSFVAPSANQMGGTLLASDAGVPGRNGRLPNLGLKPENGVGADLGLDWRLAGGLEMTARAFFNRVDDAIIDTVVSATPSQSQAQNAGRSVARGLELGARQIVSERLQWFANATLTRSRVGLPRSPDEDGSAVPFAPDRMINTGLTWQLPADATLSPALRWIGRYYDSTARSSRQRFGGYSLVDLKYRKLLERNARYAVTMTVEVNNVTNRRYAMPWGFRDPGVNAFVALQLAY